ncbi:MAG: fumarylacetoacetase [Raineya sp.]|nr:fumarylacetoacetase [Raineya sp.]MDW8297294.1 fumarylacetoacetase [Raineya sp.]
MPNIPANNPALSSWIKVPKNSDFPIQNIPFGIFSYQGGTPRACTRIGDTVIDLSVLVEQGYFDKLRLPDASVFHAEKLNDFIALGKPFWRKIRNHLSTLFQKENSTLQKDKETQKLAFYDIKEVQMHLPVQIGDYTDFYSSKEHATNVGSMFRDPKNALLPNWLHLPVGYHGRASSIVVSGTPIHRPKGQVKPPDAEKPHFTPTKLLDFELEVAFIIGKETQLGESISTAEAEDYIFGLVLFNDWSARDIQQWEYVPLGPFLAKNFASTISPWIVTLDALEPFRVASPKQKPEVLEYLKFKGKKSYDINLEVYLKPENSEKETLICRSNFKYMYWNMCQQLAHHTVNGCNVRVGDMCASGTISGKEPNSYGSMLELTWKGTKPLKLADGSERKFIEDGDTVIMRGFAEKNGVRVGFGECEGKILPAK